MTTKSLKYIVGDIIIENWVQRWPIEGSQVPLNYCHNNLSSKLLLTYDKTILLRSIAIEIVTSKCNKFQELIVDHWNTMQIDTNIFSKLFHCVKILELKF